MFSYELSTDADTPMRDSAAAAYVGVLAFHDYDNSNSISNPWASSGVHLCASEIAGASGIRLFATDAGTRQLPMQ